MPSISRRRFVKASSALALSGMALLAKAQGLRKISFVTPFGFLIGYAPTFNAQAGGHFAKQGLDVTMLPGKGSAVAVQQVIAGRALYGRGDPLAVAKAITEGAPVISFATIEHRSPMMVYSSPAKPIRTPQDMVGKTIGIAAKGSASDNVIDMMFAMAGIPLDACKRESIGNSPGGWGLIQQGRVDAHIVSLGTTTTLRESGEKIVMWNVSDVIPMPGQSYFALRDTVEKDPDTLLHILRAEKASILEIKKADGRAMVERLAKLWDIEGAKQVDFTVAAMRDEEKNWWQDDTRKLLVNDPAAWKSMTEAMLKSGLLKSGTPEQFYTNAIVSKL